MAPRPEGIIESELAPSVSPYSDARTAVNFPKADDTLLGGLLSPSSPNSFSLSAFSSLSSEGGMEFRVSPDMQSGGLDGRVDPVGTAAAPIGIGDQNNPEVTSVGRGGTPVVGEDAGSQDTKEGDSSIRNNGHALLKGPGDVVQLAPDPEEGPSFLNAGQVEDRPATLAQIRALEGGGTTKPADEEIGCEGGLVDGGSRDKHVQASKEEGDAAVDEVINQAASWVDGADATADPGTPLSVAREDTSQGDLGALAPSGVLGGPIPQSLPNSQVQASSGLVGRKSLQRRSSGVQDEDLPPARVKFLVSFGGEVKPRDGDGKLSYHGGETRNMTVARDIKYEELIFKFCEFYGTDLTIKYQLPNWGLDTLVSVTNDDDVANMMDEYDQLEARGARDGSQRLRLFLFSAEEQQQHRANASLPDKDPRTYFEMEPVLPAHVLEHNYNLPVADVPDQLQQGSSSSHGGHYQGQHTVTFHHMQPQLSQHPGLSQMPRSQGSYHSLQAHSQQPQQQPHYPPSLPQPVPHVPPPPYHQPQYQPPHHQPDYAAQHLSQGASHHQAHQQTQHGNQQLSQQPSAYGHRQGPPSQSSLPQHAGFPQHHQHQPQGLPPQHHAPPSPRQGPSHGPDQSAQYFAQYEAQEHFNPHQEHSSSHRGFSPQEGQPGMPRIASGGSHPAAGGAAPDGVAVHSESPPSAAVYLGAPAAHSGPGSPSRPKPLQLPLPSHAFHGMGHTDLPSPGHGPPPRIQTSVPPHLALPDSHPSSPTTSELMVRREDGLPSRGSAGNLEHYGAPSPQAVPRSVSHSHLDVHAGPMDRASHGDIPFGTSPPVHHFNLSAGGFPPHLLSGQQPQQSNPHLAPPNNARQSASHFVVPGHIAPVQSVQRPGQEQGTGYWHGLQGPSMRDQVQVMRRDQHEGTREDPMDTHRQIQQIDHGLAPPHEPVRAAYRHDQPEGGHNPRSQFGQSPPAYGFAVGMPQQHYGRSPVHLWEDRQGKGLREEPGWNLDPRVVPDPSHPWDSAEGESRPGSAGSARVPVGSPPGGQAMHAMHTEMPGAFGRLPPPLAPVPLPRGFKEPGQPVSTPSSSAPPVMPTSALPGPASLLTGPTSNVSSQLQVAHTNPPPASQAHGYHGSRLPSMESSFGSPGGDFMNPSTGQLVYMPSPVKLAASAEVVASVSAPGSGFRPPTQAPGLRLIIPSTTGLQSIIPATTTTSTTLAVAGPSALSSVGKFSGHSGGGQDGLGVGVAQPALSAHGDGANEALSEAVGKQVREFAREEVAEAGKREVAEETQGELLEIKRLPAIQTGPPPAPSGLGPAVPPGLPPWGHRGTATSPQPPTQMADASAHLSEVLAPMVGLEPSRADPGMDRGGTSPMAVAGQGAQIAQAPTVRASQVALAGQSQATSPRQGQSQGTTPRQGNSGELLTPGGRQRLGGGLDARGSEATGGGVVVSPEVVAQALAAVGLQGRERQQPPDVAWEEATPVPVQPPLLVQGSHDSHHLPQVQQEPPSVPLLQPQVPEQQLTSSPPSSPQQTMPLHYQEHSVPEHTHQQDQQQARVHEQQAGLQQQQQMRQPPAPREQPAAAQHKDETAHHMDKQLVGQPPVVGGAQPSQIRSSQPPVMESTRPQVMGSAPPPTTGGGQSQVVKGSQHQMMGDAPPSQQDGAPHPDAAAAAAFGTVLQLPPVAITPSATVMRASLVAPPAERDPLAVRLEEEQLDVQLAATIQRHIERGPAGSTNEVEPEEGARSHQSEAERGGGRSEQTAAQAEEAASLEGLQSINNADLEELKELGQGTFGTVYHGKWRGTDVAIKRLKGGVFEGFAMDQDRTLAEFWREARILSKLHHPNVVAFYGVVKDHSSGQPVATVTEYMVNGSLKQVLSRKDRSIDRRKRILIAMDAAFGMEYLHSCKIVHFDLKCENLLVNMRDPHRPVCKVGDLGLSKVKKRTLVTGGVRGTLPWMAPELLDVKSSHVTEKVDVYSFGICMWELLTGEEPYTDMHTGHIIGGILQNSLRPEVPSRCDPAWRSLMERCWAQDQSERPSFKEIADELRAMHAAMKP